MNAKVDAYVPIAFRVMTCACLIYSMSNLKFEKML